MTEQELQELREMLDNSSFDETFNFEDAFEALEDMDNEEFEYFRRLPRHEKRSYIIARRKGKKRKLQSAHSEPRLMTSESRLMTSEPRLMTLESKKTASKIEPGKTAIFDLKIQMQFYPVNDVYDLTGNFNVPIFGYSALLGNYKKNPEFVTSLGNQFNYSLIMPVGHSLNGISPEKASKLIFEIYGQKGDACKISVMSEQVPYSQLLFLLGSHEFVVKRIRYTFQENDANGDNKNLIVTEVSMFGKTSSDSINISSFKSPDQYQKNIIDINTEINMNADKTIWFPANIGRLNKDEKERYYSFNMIVEKL